MLLLVVLLLCASARGGAILEDPDCDGVIIRNIKYEKQVLKTGVESPFQLAIDYDTDLLFFSYQVNTDEVFKSAYLNLKTKEFGIISGINGGFANAVDNRNKIAYLGGSDGIYKFNVDSKTAINLHITDDNIWQLFYKDVLYYIEIFNQKVYKIVDGYPKIIQEINTKPLFIAVDNNDNIYFANFSGLFYYKQDGAQIIKIGDYKLNGITSDVNGYLYFSTADSLYYINDRTKQIETLATLNNNVIYGMVIESNGNIIVSYDQSVVRLKPTDRTCFSNMTTKSFE